jgi:hypothetical protein
MRILWRWTTAPPRAVLHHSAHALTTIAEPRLGGGQMGAGHDEEVVAIRRRLAEASPAAHETDLADR